MGLLLVYGLNTWLPQLMRGAGYNVSDSLVLLLVLNVGAIAGLLVGGRVADKRGVKGTTMFWFTAAAVLLALLSIRMESSLLLNGVVLVTGFFVFCAQVLVYGFVGYIYPKHVVGTGMGMVAGVGRLGAIAGPGITGLLVASGHAYPWGFYLFAGAALLGMFAVAIIPKPAASRNQLPNRPLRRFPPRKPPGARRGRADHRFDVHSTQSSGLRALACVVTCASGLMQPSREVHARESAGVRSPAPRASRAATPGPAPGTTGLDRWWRSSGRCTGRPRTTGCPSAARGIQAATAGRSVRRSPAGPPQPASPRAGTRGQHREVVNPQRGAQADPGFGKTCLDLAVSGRGVDGHEPQRIELPCREFVPRRGHAAGQ